MFTSDNPIEQTSELLEFAKDDITSRLKDHPSVLLMVASSLSQIINKLSVMTGRQTTTNHVVEHPPITNFMGEEIVYAKKIMPADMSPREADRAAYLNKVQQLYDQIVTIAPDGVLAGYTLPEDLLVIRGVAKRAGLEEYQDREIDTDFIEDIQEAIKQKAADAAAQAEIDRKLASGEGVTSPTVNTPPADDSKDEDEEEEEGGELKAADAAAQAEIDSHPQSLSPDQPSTTTATGKGSRGKKS